MSASLREIVQNLNDDDPKVRIQACKQLGKLGEPEAIVPLAQVYNNDFEDEAVRAAAADALRRYAGAGSGGGLSPQLKRLLTIGLSVSLVVLLALNVIMRMGGGGEDEPTAEETPVDVPELALSREELVQTYQTALDQLAADALSLDTEWRASATAPMPCSAELNRVQAIQPNPATQSAHPTLTDPNGLLSTMNEVIGLMLVSIDLWESACADPATASTQSGAALEALAYTIEQIGVAQAELTAAASN